MVQPVEPPAGWGALPGSGPRAAGAMPPPSGYGGVPGGSAPGPIEMRIAVTGSVSRLGAQGASPPPVSYGGPPASLHAVPPAMPRPAPAAPGPSQPVQRMPPLHSPPPVTQAEAAEGAGASAAVNAAHVRRLAALAVELEAQVAGGCDGAAIRLVRQRLTEWIEDLRSVGGSRELADAVEALVRRLSDALAAPWNLAAELQAIADELARLATGTLPPEPGGAGGAKPSRRPFWK
jgi:hypothetical protein